MQPLPAELPPLEARDTWFAHSTFRRCQTCGYGAHVMEPQSDRVRAWRCIADAGHPLNPLVGS